MMNTKISTTTIVHPTGVLAKIEMQIPTNVPTTEIIPAEMMTDLNVLNILIAASAGKIIKAEISKEPTKFMAKTITTAERTAIKMLMNPTLTPVALAKFSSNVIENILL